MIVTYSILTLSLLVQSLRLVLFKPIRDVPVQQEDFMSYIKIVSAAATTMIKFDDVKDRKKWLLKNGFLEANGTWKHIDGRRAGTFEDYDSAAVQMNCHVPVGNKKPYSLYNK